MKLSIVPEFTSISLNRFHPLGAYMSVIKSPSILMMGLISTVFLLQGCGQSSEQPKQQVEIKAAPKLTNDATAYAKEAWKLINQIEPFVYRKQLNLIEENVRKPIRKLSTDWRINVKMTDSVTDGKYALCRKALTSLDNFARSTLQKDGSLVQKQQEYERDKAQCKDAIDNPSQGNTKAYNNLF